MASDFTRYSDFGDIFASPLARRVARAVILLVICTGALVLATCLETRKTGEAERLNASSDLLVEYLDDMRFDNVSARSSLALWDNDHAANDRREIVRRIQDRQTIARHALQLVKNDAPQLVPLMERYLAAADAYNAAILANDRGPARERALTDLRLRVAQAYNVAHAEAVSWSRAWDTRGSDAVYWAGWLTILSGVLTALFACGFALFTGLSIVRPVATMTIAMQALAAGDLDVDIPATERDDEIGVMANAVLVFKQGAIDKARLERDAAAAATEAEGYRARHDAERQAVMAEQQHVVEMLADALSRLAVGDMSRALDRPFAAEYEGLRKDFNRALAALQVAIGSVGSHVHLVDAGVSQIGEAAGNLKIGAAQQAGRLQNTTSALRDVTGAVEATAGQLASISANSQAASRNAERSTATAAEAAAAMAEVNEASSEITKIVGLIDQIAFRTNFLALNAAIEANRANAGGGGFAAVAHEIRSLAKQVGDAAFEIKALTTMSHERISGAVSMVTEAQKAMQDNAHQVFAIHDATADIAASARQQSQRLAVIDRDLSSIDQITQANAAIAEGADEFLTYLSLETAKLRDSMARFNLTSHATAG